MFLKYPIICSHVYCYSNHSRPPPWGIKCLLASLEPFHTQDWEPMTIAFQALSSVENTELVHVHYFTLRLRDQRSMWMQDGCKVYMDSYMASNGSCFMVTWIIFRNHLLEVGLTQNHETMALWMFTTVGLFYFYHVRGPAWIEICWHSIWLWARVHMTSHYTWGSVTALHDFGGALERPLGTFFWALIIPWSRLLARVWSGPNMELTYTPSRLIGRCGQWTLCSLWRVCVGVFLVTSLFLS
jgi:hypothetical protein